MQYQNFEARGSAALGLIQSGSLVNRQREAILKKNGIKELKDDEWYNLDLILGAFKDIGEQIGQMNLFAVGKSVMEKAEFPPISSLREALESIDVAYHMNHRKDGQVMFNPQTGEKIDGIGHYTLTSYDEENRQATMVCKTPYPSKFEEGLIVEIVRRFRPSDSLRSKVKLDDTQETRLKGGESCSFTISW